MNPIKLLFTITPLVLCLALALTSCTSHVANPPPLSVPRTETEQAVSVTLDAYDSRLADISSYLEVASHEITDKPTVALLTPARVLAGPPSDTTVKEAGGILEAAKAGDLGPSQVAVASAQGRVGAMSSLRDGLNSALEADRASLRAYLDSEAAAYEFEMRRDRARFWNLINGLMVAAGAVVTALGVFVRILSVQVPIFGPKAAGAIIGAGGSLAAGGVCLYAMGPHLSILAAALGVAALLALVAGVLIYANKAHEKTP